jgi:NHLM bacteriocin system ABC transporter ATP-binding protein
MSSSRTESIEPQPPGERRSESLPFRGQPLELGGNRPFVPDEHHLWYVERGEVNLFSVPNAGEPDGAPGGPRRHLLRVPTGGILMGLGSPRSSRRLVAVATNGSRLLQMPCPSPAAWGEEGDGGARLRRLLLGWIESVCRAVVPGRPPTKGLSLVPSQDVTAAEPGPAIPGEGVVWVRPLAGSPLLLGREELALGQSVFTPLASPAWIEVPEGARLQVTDLDGLPGPDAFWAGLQALHALASASLSLQAADEERAAAERGRRLAANNQATIQQACAQLASAIQGGGPTSDPLKSEAFDPASAGPHGALLACCRLVAGEMGTTIRPPSEADGPGMLRDPLAAIVRSSRLRARKVALRGDWWRSDQGPLLGFTAEGQRPVALLRKGRTYFVHDPAAPGSPQAPAPVDAGRAQSLSPFAHSFYLPFPEGRLAARDLVRFGARGCGRDFALVAAMALGVTVLGMVPALATGLLFNTVIPGAQRSQLWQVTLLLVVCAMANVGFSTARGVALLRIQQRMGNRVLAAVWDRLMRLPLSFFHPYTAGDLATRAMSIDGIQLILSGAALTAILNGLFSFGNLALMFFYSPPLAWQACALLGFALVVTALGGLLQRRPERAILKLRGKTSGLVLQLLTSISKLRVAGAEARAFSRWVNCFSEQRRMQLEVRSLANRLFAFNAAFPVAASALIFLAGLPQLTATDGNTALRTGDFLAFTAAFNACLAALLGFCRTAIESLSATALYERAQPILQTLPESQAGKSDPGTLSGDIELQHVVFRYNQDGPPALRDVSLHVRPGEFVAFVGPSGSGKSTLLKLLLGFELLESGAIYYDGQEIGGLDIQEIRRQMGVVLQNGRLVVGDIFRNIVGSSNATQEEAWEAARLAGIADDIMAMPMKMHTVIGEDAGTLSGGQRQRLMIARAIVNRPRILLFDEATSALDNRTQAIVTASLEGLKATRIVVAHRLSTIAKADNIYVVDRGRIVESGSYAQLMKEKGPFAELARRQLV